MQNPWDVRPRASKGDANEHDIYHRVGQALTAWEMLESDCAELFDAIVAAQPSNRAAFSAFTAVKSASARTELLQAAAERALPSGDPARADVLAAIDEFGKFGARRNEIAHGRAYNLNEHGFYLGPNNVMPHKFDKVGAAKYQYTNDDIAYYVDQFEALRQRVIQATQALVQRNVAARKTSSTRSRRNDRGNRT